MKSLVSQFNAIMYYYEQMGIHVDIINDAVQTALEAGKKVCMVTIKAPNRREITSFTICNTTVIFRSPSGDGNLELSEIDDIMIEN